MNKKQFQDLMYRDTVYFVQNIETGHEPMQMSNPFAIKKFLFFKKDTLGVVGETYHFNHVDEEKLKSIHSDKILPNVQPSATLHHTVEGTLCTTKEEAEETMKQLVIERIQKHEKYIKELRKEYYDILN
jgi:hypothetical protein